MNVPGQMSVDDYVGTFKTPNIGIKPEHEQYTDLRIHLVLPAAQAKRIGDLLLGDTFRPYLHGAVVGSEVLSYLDALTRVQHYRRGGK